MTDTLVSQMALIVSLALFFGMVVQTLAQHLRLPAIVLLLLTGGLLGPDVLGWIKPEIIHPVLPAIVGYAVAIILFEGGLNLRLSRLRRESTVLRRLVTYGAVLTGIGGTVAARLFLHWPWEIAAMFGSLVIVTGPTVVTPLLRRIKISHNLHTLLEGEGVLIDPIGAIIAIFVLQLVLHPSQESFFHSVVDALLQVGVGTVLGLIGGFALAGILRVDWLVPEELINVFTLGSVLALFHVSDLIQPESGIAAVVVAGLVVGNVCGRILRDLRDFKEQLSVMLIATMFILLAADVRVEELLRLGWPGLATVGVLMFVVRPITAAVCTRGTGMPANQVAFLGWLAPRGIVAAAIASFLAVELEKAGIPGGEPLRALVFLVIAVTVIVQGITAGPVARLLRVRRRASSGYAILGASELARTLASELQAMGKSVVLIDSNADACNRAEAEGLRVVFGNAMDERVLVRARLDDCLGAVGLTPNEELNMLFTGRAREQYKVRKGLVAIRQAGGHMTVEAVHEAGVSVLFGVAREVDSWSVRLRRERAIVEYWRRDVVPRRESSAKLLETMPKSVVPMIIIEKDSARLVDDTTEFPHNVRVAFLVSQEQYDEATSWLIDGGWRHSARGESAEAAPDDTPRANDK